MTLHRLMNERQLKDVLAEAFIDRDGHKRQERIDRERWVKYWHAPSRA